MGDDDFMAALSRAFQESEQQRGAGASRGGPAEEEETNVSAGSTPGDTEEEPREE
jgi:hypothetical protein